MCKSKAEGGARCYSHTRESYKTSIHQLKAATRELKRKHSIMAKLNAEMAQLDYAYEDGRVDDETYNREIDRIVGHRKKGKSLIAHDETRVARLKKTAAGHLAEMRTTNKGLSKLEKQIEAEKNPEKKRELRAVYNMSRRVNLRRLRAGKAFKLNQEKAQKLYQEAESKMIEANAIDPKISPDHARARDEAIFEAQKLSAEAHLAKNNGNMESQALFNARTGELVPAKLVDGKYGKAWAILSDPHDPNSATKKLISPPRGKTYASRAAFWENKGIRLGTVWVPGKVIQEEDEFGNKKVFLARADGGFYPYAAVGTPDVYKEKVKEEAAQKKAQS